MTGASPSFHPAEIDECSGLPSGHHIARGNDAETRMAHQFSLTRISPGSETVTST